MLTSLQALLRLASLRWLGVFVCALTTLLATTSGASAIEPAQTKTRVWGFDFAEHNSVGLFRAASPRTHLENRSSSSELTSGSLLAAKAARAAKSVAKIKGGPAFPDLKDHAKTAQRSPRRAGRAALKVELSDEAKRQARDENAWWRKNRDHQRIFTEELRAARKVLKDGPKHQISDFLRARPTGETRKTR